MKQLLFQHLDQLSTARWARRGVRTLLRAAWLSVCVWCIGLGGHLLWGWPLRIDLLGALALAIIGVALALLLVPKLSRRSAADRLDRRFHLDEQLATAVEVAATNPPPGSVAARLLAESGHTAALLHHRLSQRSTIPWHDLLTLAAIALVALGLWIISGIGLPNLATSAPPLPPLASAEDPARQLPAEPQGDGDTGLPVPVPGAGAQPGPGPADQRAGAGEQPGAADPQVLQALADALRDQGATRPAAQALDRGDTAEAARALRELADQAGQLSQATRDALAERLRAAAGQVEDRSPEMADQLRQSARALTQGGQQAAQALDDLARAIEQLPSTAPPDQGDQAGQQPQGDQGQGQNEGQGQGESAGAGRGPGGEQRQSTPAQRLGVEGQPVPLEAAGEGELPIPPSGQQQSQPGAGSRPGFTQGDAGGGQVNVGADPLRVPIDERDVVQAYFQP